jgi:hypothetical protein
MAAEPKVIDIDDSPELIQLVDQLIESREGALLRRNGSIVAVITPLQTRDRGRLRKMDPAEAARILRETVGGWEGLVDADQLIADIYAARDLDRRELPNP